jgi:hypothetical protein
MNFGVAFGLLREGKAIKRVGWDCWLEIRELEAHRESLPPENFEICTFIVLVQSTGEHVRWSPFDQDLLAEDWEVTPAWKKDLVV